MGPADAPMMQDGDRQHRPINQWSLCITSCLLILVRFFVTGTEPELKLDDVLFGPEAINQSTVVKTSFTGK